MSFRNPILAGVELVRAAIQSADYVPGVSGWAIMRNGDAEFSGVMIRGADVVDSVQLFYNGTPAAGNLIVSISPTAGTDAYGNAYQAGLVSYDGGGDFIEQSNSGNVGWGLHLAGLATNGQIGMFATGAGTAQQGHIEIEPATGSSNGPPILNLVSESADSTQAGYIGLFNSDTVQLNPQTGLETVLEYLNLAGTIVRGWGVVSDQSTNRHFHSATYSGTTGATGLFTFNHLCGFTPLQAFLTSVSPSGTVEMQLHSLSATQAVVSCWGLTGVSQNNQTITIDVFFIG